MNQGIVLQNVSDTGHWGMNVNKAMGKPMEGRHDGDARAAGCTSCTGSERAQYRSRNSFEPAVS